MQRTNFKEFIDSFLLILNSIVSYSWTKRSVLILSVLFGFYFTNSFLSFLLDKSFNTIFLAVTIVVAMEISIRMLLFTSYSKLRIIILANNNFRIGATYALILEAFKLGS